MAAAMHEEEGGERKQEREEEGSGMRAEEEEKELASSIRPVQSDPVRFCWSDSIYKILNFYSALGPKTRLKNFEKILENSEKFVESKYIFSFATLSLN